MEPKKELRFGRGGEGDGVCTSGKEENESQKGKSIFMPVERRKYKKEEMWHAGKKITVAGCLEGIKRNNTKRSLKKKVEKGREVKMGGIYSIHTKRHEKGRELERLEKAG